MHDGHNFIKRLSVAPGCPLGPCFGKCVVKPLGLLGLVEVLVGFPSAFFLVRTFVSRRLCLDIYCGGILLRSPGLECVEMPVVRW